ncbi:NAD(+) diphosphatase [Neptuniibacter sp.]|uniref:NAD(+) diphosphatase n=1 Tax=Neptuniibacter sp. TaxID=1962643 RepID=UPI003B5B1583
MSELYFLASGERLLGTDQGPVILSGPEMNKLNTVAVLKVGEVDSKHYFVALLSDEEPLKDILKSDLVGLRSLLALVQSEDEYCLLSTASQLVTWFYSFKYCPRCTAPLELHKDERAKVCHQCGHHQYPRISPCIIVLVRKGEQCLLAHAAKFASGRYSTLAGFIEAGESAEQAVHREIMEEVGIKVKNLRYCFSQSWPFPHSFMLGFMAEYDEGEITPDGIEILDADWFDPDKMPVLPPRFTIARRLINQFLEEIGREIEPDSDLFFPAE